MHYGEQFYFQLVLHSYVQIPKIMNDIFSIKVDDAIDRFRVIARQIPVPNTDGPDVTLSE